MIPVPSGHGRFSLSPREHGNKRLKRCYQRRAKARDKLQKTGSAVSMTPTATDCRQTSMAWVRRARKCCAHTEQRVRIRTAGTTFCHIPLAGWPLDGAKQKQGNGNLAGIRRRSGRRAVWLAFRPDTAGLELPATQWPAPAHRPGRWGFVWLHVNLAQRQRKMAARAPGPARRFYAGLREGPASTRIEQLDGEKALRAVINDFFTFGSPAVEVPSRCGCTPTRIC